MMKFDQSISIGTIVTIGVLLVSFSVAWGINQISVADLKAHQKSLSGSIEQSHSRLHVVEILNAQVSSDVKYIKEALAEIKTDIKDLKTRQ